VTGGIYGIIHGHKTGCMPVGDASPRRLSGSATDRRSGGLTAERNIGSSAHLRVDLASLLIRWRRRGGGEDVVDDSPRQTRR